MLLLAYGSTWPEIPMHFHRDELLTDARVAQKEGIRIIVVHDAACDGIQKMRATRGLRAIHGKRVIRAVRAVRAVRAWIL
jgi:hypothetical protein